MVSPLLTIEDDKVSCHWLESNFELIAVVKDHLLVQRNFESANESLVPISKDLPFVLQTSQYLPQVSEKYGEQGHISKLNPDVAILHQFHFQPTSVQLQPCCEQQQGVSLLLTVVLSCKFLEITNLS